MERGVRGAVTGLSGGPVQQAADKEQKIMFGKKKDDYNDARRISSGSDNGLGWGQGNGDGIVFGSEERVSDRPQASCIGNGNGSATGNWQNSHIGIVT